MKATISILVDYVIVGTVITSCDTANALGSTMFYTNVIDGTTNGSCGGTGGHFIFFCADYYIVDQY